MHFSCVCIRVGLFDLFVVYIVNVKFFVLSVEGEYLEEESRVGRVLAT